MRTFLKNVDGQGTLSIIKNLKKSKRFEIKILLQRMTVHFRLTILYLFR